MLACLFSTMMRLICTDVVHSLIGVVEYNVSESESESYTTLHRPKIN